MTQAHQETMPEAIMGVCFFHLFGGCTQEGGISVVLLAVGVRGPRLQIIEVDISARRATDPRVYINGGPLLGLPTTTSAVERFHLNQQQSVHHVSHPSIPVCLDDLHRQTALADLRMASVLAGDRREPGPVFSRKWRGVRQCWHL